MSRERRAPRPPLHFPTSLSHQDEVKKREPKEILHRHISMPQWHPFWRRNRLILSKDIQRHLKFRKEKKSAHFPLFFIDLILS